MGQQVSHHPSHGAGQEGGSPALGIGHLLGDGDRDMLRLGWGGTSAHGLGLAREACGWEGQGWAVWSWRPAELGTWDPGRAWRGWAGAVRAGGALGALPRSLSITLHTKSPIWTVVIVPPFGFVASGSQNRVKSDMGITSQKLIFW